MAITRSGLSEDEFNCIERDLQLKGYREVANGQKLIKGQYSITSGRGTADSFEGGVSYSISWYESL